MRLKFPKREHTAGARGARREPGDAATTGARAVTDSVGAPAAQWDGTSSGGRTGLDASNAQRLTPKELMKRAVATAMLGMALLTPLQSKRATFGLPPPPPPKTSTLQSGSSPLIPTPPTPDGSDPDALEDIELVTNGVSQTAVDEALAVITALKVEPRFQKPFRRAEIVVVIVPFGTSLTALPEFAALKGTLTFDNRLWDDVRGVGGHSCHDGKICVAVPEENLAKLPADPYGANSIAMHELTHAVLDHVVGRKVRQHVSALFDKRKEEGKPFVSAYGASNVQEYWAESTNAYFSRHGERDFAWLAANDPAMVAVLHEVYGPPIASP